MSRTRFTSLRPLVTLIALASLSGCDDAMTSPVSTDAGLVPVASANQPTGAPVVDRAQTSFAATVPCMTFDMRIEAVGSDVSQTWFHANGNVDLFRLHRRQNAMFTNLSSGLSLTNVASLNLEARFDENGLPTLQVINGAPQKIHEGDGGKKVFYHIGHWVFTFDFSVNPPVIEETFSGRSNQDSQAGPCVALGDPAP